MTSGCRLAHYELLDLLGRGGMGAVYRGYDTRLQRDVAVKVLRPAPEGHARARVWREARAAARVNHPGICQTYDVGEVGATLFLVMELLTGESLATRLRRGALPFDDAIKVALGILAGVDALHGRRIVHRDLKPSNVHLTDQGIKLLDFGLARPGHGDTAADVTITAPGTVIGTPRYMAPEQWIDVEPDPRTDLFAVGLLLFEMLTGTPACRGDNIYEIYHSVMTAHPPALSGSAAVVAVDSVIHRALEKRPEDRYQTADAMAQALRGAVSFAEPSGGLAVRSTTRVVVLPFRMLRPDADLEFLSFSLPDAITTSLAGLQSLVVRSMPAATGVLDTADLRELTSRIGVDAVVCGTLLRAGDQVRVNAKLLSASGGTVLWSSTEQVSLTHLFDVQDQLVKSIVSSLAVPLSAREQKRLGRELPSSARAYEFYLRANQLSRQSEMLSIAERLYRSSLEEDPDYAPAWAHLGRVCRLLAKYGIEDTSANLEHAEQAFARALSIDPDLSAAHNLYTYFEVESLGRPKEAMTRLLVRLQTDAANPELFAALVLACRYCGLLDASLAADRQARRLDPAIRTSVAYTHFMRADWTRAMEHDVDDVRWVTNWCLPMLGREREAIVAYQEVAARPLPERMRRLGDASRLALERRRDECLDAVGSFQDQAFDPEGLYFAGRALIRVDEHERAIDMLERVVERGFFCLEAFVRDPWLDPIRRGRRFQKLMCRAEERCRDAEHELRRLDSHHLLTL
jgi:serine/threonine protein kinase/tetratricopeptide (TPR) repeat protein